MIYHVAVPGLVHLRFEWHPQTKRAYVVWLSATPPTGECIAEEVDTVRSARRFVAVWILGYRAGRRELAAMHHLDEAPSMFPAPKDNTNANG